MACRHAAALTVQSACGQQRAAVQDAHGLICLLAAGAHGLLGAAACCERSVLAAGAARFGGQPCTRFKKIGAVAK